MRHAPSLALALTIALVAGPAPVAAAESGPVGVLAPTPEPGFPVGAWLQDAGVASAASGAMLGLAAWSGPTGPVNALGPAGQALLVGAVGTLPPAAMLRVTPEGFRLDSYLASLTGGLVGLGLGFLATSTLGGSSPGGLDVAVKVGAMAIGQGLFASGAYHLYEGYKPTATDLDKLPEHRTDDPILNWKLQRERRNP